VTKLLFLFFLLVPGALHAQSAADLRAAAGGIAANIASQESAGGFDRAAQVKAVEQLGPLATDFIRISDQAAFAGGAGAQRDSLRSAYIAIKEPLQKVYDKNNAYLQSSTQKVIDADGDLEALQDSEPYRNAQVVASQALYFLNWLHYYGARLYDGKESKDLLEKAQAGFSEFAVGEVTTDLSVESLLGRGLCNLELGNVEFAVHDLSAVAKDEKASQERRAKARFALLDAYVRSGNVKQALPLSEELLASTRGDEANWVRFLRIRALLDGAKKTGGADGDRYRQLALAMMEQLGRGGSGWADRVTALAQTEIQNPEEWSKKAQSPFAKWELAKLLAQKNDYSSALPLLEDVVSANDESLKSQMPEAHYILGLAKFKAGEYLEAADQLEQALAGEKQSFAADAAYVRFKALEAAVAADPTSVEPERYEQALRSFLTDHSGHASAFEAQYRLGEYLQAQGRFSQAIDTYAKVSGDKGFELQAQFATMQCSFELLRDTTRAPARQALLQRIGEQLDRFDAAAAAYESKARRDDQTPVKDMRAKAAVMRSVHLRQQSPVDHQAVLAALAGFEDKYGVQEELMPQVVRIRLEMYQALGRFADADAEVKAHAAEIARLEPAQVEQLAVGFIREGARRHGRGDTAANEAAQQVALRFYEGLAGEEAPSVKTQLTLARLYENTGKPDKARELYQQVIDAKGDSSSALRGLGRIAEGEKRLDDALGYWKRLVAGTRPGDFPWYESSYEVARLTHAQGKTEDACRLLEEMKPTMPGLSDADLRSKLDVLYKQACK
jgi:TolA-binding protein